jgi:putative membrane protein
MFAIQNLLFAVDEGFFPERFWQGFLSSILFGLLGIALILFGFKLFDWITPKIDVQKELAEKHNIAVAIVVGAMIIGVCYLVATAIH